ncbi:MAG TPA: hypothetical protein VL754_17935 [Verrucomicrobiae bacterium]|jgi:hypothetical protein|nr:hypothetical protein [Verrucomicrobiae bacterium]
MNESRENGTALASTAPPLTAIAYFIVIFALVSVSIFVQKSPTVDEPMHLFAGYSYLKYGDFRANSEHPPLAKMWAALPLLAFPIKDFRIYPQWERITETFVPTATVEAAHETFFVDNEAEPLFFFAKLQMIAVAIILGIFVSLWAGKLFGREAAVAALAIFGLDPTILAHSSIIHTDVPFAACLFIGTYCYWRFLSETTLPRLILTALCFALASITKYAGPAVFLIWLLLGAVWIFSNEDAAARGRWKKTASVATALAAAALMAYVFIWAVYGFRYNAIPGAAHQFHFEWVTPAEGSLLRWPVLFVIRHRLFPEAWLYGQIFVLSTLRRPAYLLGQISPDGFWSYFPVAFAVKTPLAALILAAASLWTIARGGIKRADACFLILPAAVYFALAVISRMNIGVRHILPIYPFLFVLIAGTAVRMWKSGELFQRIAVAVLALWYVGASAWIYPDDLAYFNEAAGGPKNGYKIIVDSNLDWGQDLKGLKLWMEREGVDKIRFVHFGFDDPEYYGIDASYLPGTWVVFDPPATQSPGPARYIAVSPSLLYSPFIVGRRPKVAFVEQFKGKEPIARIGYSIFIFKAEQAESNAR